MAGIMVVGQIIVLSTLFLQTLSAPSGCIESCNFYHTSYQSQQTSGGSQDHVDHANLVRGSTSLNDRDYVRPGNWTERNQYRIDDGHGKVHEERGQYVDSSKRVRYYKKNFTSSYGTGGVNEGATELGQLSDRRGYDSTYVPSQRIDSRTAYEQSAATSARGSEYNRVHSQQTQLSSTRIENSRNERLEDFGEYGGQSQVNQRVPVVDEQTIDTQHHVETTPGNWSRVDSYRTDGGRGQVFEEEGQYVTGPKKVRYYKKNYTNSYSTSGVPQVGIGSTLQNLHNEMQQNLHEQLDSFRRDFHQTSSAGHTASTTHGGSTQGITQETVGFHGGDLQTSESDVYRQHEQYGQRRVPSTGTIHHVEQQQRETFTDTRQHTPYTYPSTIAGGYGTESQRAYQSHETHVSRIHPTSQPDHYVQAPVIGANYQTHTSSGRSHMIDEIQRAEQQVLDSRKSSRVQNQLLTQEDTQRAYRPGYTSVHPSGGRGQTTHYEEHWSSSSSSHTGDRNLAPVDVQHVDRSHYDRVAQNERRGHYHDAAQGYNSRAHTSESGYNSAYRTSTGQLVTGTLDVGQVGQDVVDCAEESQQYQQETRYHRKYKRDNRQQHRTRPEHEDFMQQSQDFGQETQQLEKLTNADLSQQSEVIDHLAQQSTDRLQSEQQTVGDQHLEDLTQQSEQFTQQTDGQLEFGQQTVGDRHLENLTQQSEQFAQQTEGQLEFGQRTVANQRLEDLTQQSEKFTQQTAESDDLTQRTNGKLEFGQQTVNDQRLEDLTQQSEQFMQHTADPDLTQQTIGKLELGQQTVNDQRLEDLTQQSEQFMQHTADPDLTQQTIGKLEFGQQTVGDQHLEDLTQKSEQFMQQGEDQLEFGQQTVDNQRLEHLTQQTERLQQQAEDDRTQQTVGKLEFGQQSDDSQRLEHLTQQTEQFTQQTEGQLEFGQQSVNNRHLEDLTQQNEKFTQQTAELDDFTQRTNGKLEFGQQTVRNQHLGDQMQQSEDLAQQTTNEFTQQTLDRYKFGQQNDDTQQLEQHVQPLDKFNKPISQQFKEFNQQNEDFTQQTTGTDFTQQMMGQLEYGQQMQQSDRFSNSEVSDMEGYTQQNEDITQQVGGFYDSTQRTGEYGQQREQQKPGRPRYNEHLTQQQSGWNIDDSQQSYQHPSYNNEQSKWQIEQMSQKTDFDRDFTQQTDREQQSTSIAKPAPKPRPRQRYPKLNSTPSHIDGTDTNLDDVFRPTEIKPEADIDNVGRETVQSDSHVTQHNFDNLQSRGSSRFDNEKENMDRLHWVHTSNDATVGLQWHYTYHPSDLTNIESSQNSYYPHYNTKPVWQQTENDEDTQQQSKSVDFSQQETEDKHTFKDTHQDSHTQSSQIQDNTYVQQTGSFQVGKSHFDQSQFDQNSDHTPSRVVPLQQNQHSQQTESQLEFGQRTVDNQRSELNEQSTQSTTGKIEHTFQPRILEAYGGGPYDASRGDDVYSKVTPNPSAVLPPIGGEDPWDIREKPKEIIPWSIARTLPAINTPKVTDVRTIEPIETTTQIMEITTEETPSFWSRIGNKISRTYDKAKEKARGLFG